MDTDTIAAGLRVRLAELTESVAQGEVERRAPLDTDWQEAATEKEDADALAGIEATHLTEIAGIEAALARIAAGEYGSCSVCGIEIPAARLAALPTATICVNHSKV